MALSYLAVVLLLTVAGAGLAHGDPNYTEAEVVFAQELVKKYGSNDTITAAQSDALLKDIRKVIVGGAASPTSAGHGSSSNGGGGGGVQGGSGGSSGGKPSACNITDSLCLRTVCLNGEELFKLHDLPMVEGANITQLKELSPSLLYQLQNEDCYVEGQEAEPTKKHRPSEGEVWGYSVLAVTIINICPALGLVVYPLMNTRIYRKVLMWMVGLAVGTLSGSAIFVLIPEAFELMEEHSPFKDVYLWRTLVMMAGIYLFFTIERLLGFIFKKDEHSIMAISLGRGIAPRNNDLADKAQDTSSGAAKKKEIQRTVSPGISNKGFDDEEKPGTVAVPEPEVPNHHAHHAIIPVDSIKRKWTPVSQIKSVAWMVIFGDALHNFVDGLNIGSAFTESPLAGVSISLAIFCEELPHELGDFAVLLASGMSLRQAVGMNLLSAMTCYIGMIVGIQVGFLEDGALWIFSIAGGMFLYISLVDMLPELNEQAREEKRLTGHVVSVYIIQNIGLLMGWAAIFLLALYSSNIEFQ